MPEINAKNLALIVGLLSQLNAFVPEVKEIIALVMDWIGKQYPDLTAAQRVALLKQHIGENTATLDAWFAAHPE